MTYDALAESMRLIESGLPPNAVRLSRRRRFVPLAVDVDGDAAAAVFARRGAGTDWLQEHLLYRRDGEWSVHGGAWSSIDLDELSHRWTPEPDRPHARRNGGASVDIAANRRMPWGACWLHSAWVEVSGDVRRVAVGARTIEVPWHGNVVVVWLGKRAPLVNLLGDDGAALGDLDLGRTS